MLALVLCSDLPIKKFVLKNNNYYTLVHDLCLKTDLKLTLQYLLV